LVSEEALIKEEVAAPMSAESVAARVAAATARSEGSVTAATARVEG
jgi:hypothetical protein